MENAVNQCYTQVFTKVHHKEYESIDSLNAAIHVALKAWNNESYQNLDGCRSSEFENYEKNQLAPLPGELFQLTHSTLARIQRNYHVFRRR